MNIWLIVLSVAMFGALIFIHEFGHYTAARAFGVSIREFAIGMGPMLVSHVSKKTGIRYSLRALPIGGYVSMVGEDEDSDEPGAFNKKPVWQRMIITAAGAVTNIVLGFLIMTVLVIGTETLGGTRIAQFFENSTTQQCGLLENDEILKLGKTRVHVATDLVYTIMHDGKEPLDVTVRRDGKTVVVPDVVFPTFTESGHTFGDRDFYVYAVEKTPGEVAKQALWQSVNTVEMIWESLIDMVAGEYSVKDMSGPVGVTEAISTAAEEGTSSFVYMMVFITINLGIMNLLPLPALDGGRLFFQLLECIRRKPVNPVIEGYIHFAGIVILMLFMAFVTVQDIGKLMK